MNEALRNLTVLLWALTAVNTSSHAQTTGMNIQEEAVQESPTLIYGASKKSPTESDEVLIEQPANAGNPLGNPIVDDAPLEENPFAQVDPVEPISPSPAKKTQKPVESNTAPTNNYQAGPNSAQQIDNTLYESGNRIYDLQSYPVDDVNKVMQPNTQPTISNDNY